MLDITEKTDGRIALHCFVILFLRRVWDQCNVVQDYLTVYDGSATTDPVLVRLCGGDVVPDIVSSGPNMLLEFHTSPFDNPFHPVPLSYLPGFELEVQITAIPGSVGLCKFLCAIVSNHN
ncbi:hypothetical protein L9F63_009940, partial [Diploptera punctata]